LKVELKEKVKEKESLRRSPQVVVSPWGCRPPECAQEKKYAGFGRKRGREMETQSWGRRE
jgi:hypothetical protein